MKLLTERSYPLGGVAFSVPLDYKIATYEKMNKLCGKNNIKFNTCRCKDITLRDTGYPLICRNIDFYKNKSF